MVTNALNFLILAVDFKVFEGWSIRASVREIYVPVLPVEFATGLLTAGVAFAYQGHNLAVIGLIAVIGLVFQYLLRTALNSISHKEQLEGRSRELASLQVGLLGTVLQTLSLRDKMTARHSAAVARYSREIARELGLSEREQDIVHTAALLHDIGKFIFPDSILFADKKLTRRISRSSAATRSRGLGSSPRIDGYGPVAEIILAHHERIDGNGYPSGLVGEQIPLAARIIAVADTYDVMTARDSYREPVTSARGGRGASQRRRTRSSTRASSRPSSACSNSAPSLSGTPTTRTSSASSTSSAAFATTRSPRAGRVSWTSVRFRTPAAGPIQPVVNDNGRP